MTLEPKVKIESKYRENIETVKGLAKLAVGNSSFGGYSEYLYIDEEKIISVELRKRNVRICVYYRNGKMARERHTLSYSALEN